jgi:hypothetical protein
MKAENSFIQELESKAKEQQRLVQTEIIPEWAKGFGGWLAVNPWRVLVPVSVLLYLVLRIIIGTPYRELVLGLFGGFVR